MRTEFLTTSSTPSSSRTRYTLTKKQILGTTWGDSEFQDVWYMPLAGDPEDEDRVSHRESEVEDVVGRQTFLYIPLTKVFKVLPPNLFGDCSTSFISIGWDDSHFRVALVHSSKEDFGPRKLKAIEIYSLRTWMEIGVSCGGIVVKSDFFFYRRGEVYFVTKVGGCWCLMVIDAYGGAQRQISLPVTDIDDIQFEVAELGKGGGLLSILYQYGDQREFWILKDLANELELDKGSGIPDSFSRIQVPGSCFSVIQGHILVYRDPETKQSAMTLSVESGNIDAIQVLIEAGYVLDCSVDLFLHDAAAMERLDLLEILCLGYPDLDLDFHLAAIQGNLSVIRFLVSSGTDPDVLDCRRWTPLHYATEEGHVQVVEYLLNQSISAKYTRARDGKTAYDIALEEGHSQLYHILYSGDVLHSAARRGDIESIQACLAESGGVANVDLNSRDQNGWTPLHRAAFKGKIECENACQPWSSA
ncbi:OLC1v1007430C1 [Oldenlandia corymbosa var. corymbosa]|uniref:OLC1v1007430C1 n=1 Tax=Oldenlandia corymbosa var. corymbosa TaxID=529605 RepID=A0AAV1DJB2_OLDCO|nr:OLC1v1007430C1 [Oldenlandia corymbosa var. corymbosa]